MSYGNLWRLNAGNWIVLLVEFVMLAFFNVIVSPKTLQKFFMQLDERYTGVN